eukprot:GABV01000587.1.p1 GENE.GABV01000587.1~~GABV01000587.1.p1  ORF type:complete len:411 (+),score=177.70 GABV01000587.1:28-1233(+)
MSRPAHPVQAPALPDDTPIASKPSIPVSKLSDSMPVVVLDYESIAKGDNLLESIKEGFGPDGLGLVIVKNVPGFVDAKQKLLPLAHKFASLPKDVQDKYTDAKSHWSFGWSHGKEAMKNGKPDFAKGSFYANPFRDSWPEVKDDLKNEYASFFGDNLWPTEHIPEMEQAFKDLSRMIAKVGFMLLRQCDAYVKSVNPKYKETSLFDTVSKSLNCKARLLHYFPIDEAKAAAVADEADKEDQWCGWHLDHGSLTGLAGALFTDTEGQQVPNPDPENAGLWIKNRAGQLVHVVVPPEYMAFQIGETAQIASGGALQATPHCVRGAGGPAAVGIGREQLAIFTEPEFDDLMAAPEGVKPEDVLHSEKDFLPPGVPTLGTRWEPTGQQTFGAFSEKTIQAYAVED